MKAKRIALLLVPVISLGLVGLAWWLTPEVVEQRFAPDGAINDSTRAQITLLRIGLCVLAVLIPVLIAIIRCLRVPFLRDYHVSTAHGRQPAPGPSLSAGELMGRLAPRNLAILLWLALPAWYALVQATFHWRIQWPQCFTAEHGILENTAVALFLVGTVSALTVVLRRRDPERPTGLHRWWIMVLGLFCLFVALEETNWGQVYFRFDTPELIGRVNYQGDFSLHNLRLPGALPLTPTYWANALSQWLAAGLAVVPSLLWISSWLQRLVWRWEIPVPPLLAQAYCAAGALMPSEAMMFNNTDTSTRMMLPSEMREFCIAVALAIWLLAELNRRRLYNHVALSSQNAPPAIEVVDAT